MSNYIERKTIPVSVEIAWQALSKMNIWLPTLSTNQSVEYDTSTPFFVEGRNYNVKTKENIIMKSQLYKIDPIHYKVEIHAKFFILKSFLTCQVNSMEDGHCEIVRTQSYPGFFGKIFTSFFNKRESGETSEYLNVWENYALDMVRK